MPLRHVSVLFCVQKLFFLPLRFTPCISLCCRNAERRSKAQNSAFSVDFRIGVFTLVTRGWAASEFLTQTSKFNMTPNGAFWRGRQFFDARVTNMKTLNSPSVGLPIKRRFILVNSIVLKLLLTCTLLKVLPSQSSRLKHYFFLTTWQSAACSVCSSNGTVLLLVPNRIMRSISITAPNVHHAIQVSMSGHWPGEHSKT